jgi:protein gp37
MGRNSAIEWTHHTFNPWWGCTKVSPACHHCYAESWARRVGHDVWGSTARRRNFTDEHWRSPLVWNREAERTKIRRRVFCASMADVFEGRRDLDRWRKKLWTLIAATSWLDWLLLTKRPENVMGMTPWPDDWPSNVWIGTTVENQEWGEKRLPHLVSLPAEVRFVSCEPLLDRLDLTPWLPSGSSDRASAIDWVIAGGESGPQARPMRLEWVRQIRDQCVARAVPFHFKQWGEWAPYGGTDTLLRRLGKKAAGRRLDGRTWDQLPTVAPYGLAFTVQGR